MKNKGKEPNRKSKQSLKNIALLIIAAELVLVSLSLYDSVLAWVLLLVGCGTVIRVAIYANFYNHLPSIRTLNLLAILSVLGLIYSGLTLGFLLGMVNLLVLACALKLMQVRSQRDVYQLILSLFFLIGCGFIFNQSIGLSIFYFLMSLILLLSLAFYHAPSINLKIQLKTVTILSLQALPIGLLLFLVLPQLPPLWQTPKSKSTKTGLSEQITPGDIAALSQSSKLAFRATFLGAVPIARERYWRAIVMENFDGKTWSIAPHRKQLRSKQALFEQEFSPTLTGTYIDYDVIAEPTHQKWLFALDLAIPRDYTSDNNIWQSDDFRLINEQKLVSKYPYKLRSYTQALSKQVFSKTDQQLNLMVPKFGNKKTKEWVKTLRNNNPSNSEFVQALLLYFTQQSFVYTLRPDVMLVDPIDKFLFDKQAGFCSHYASALAYSLRLGDVPARIVTGYQGGELVQENNQAPYLSVYQYDAHAWVEAWTDNQGWHRLDPTALVSPDRINFGLRQAMLEEGSFLADSPFSLARLTNIAWLNSVRLFLADLDYDWSRWVLGFNQQKQQDLFKAILGKLTSDRMSLLGFTIVVIIGLLLTLFFLPHWLNRRLDKTQRYYLQALNLFEKNGTCRANWQGPNDFSQQVTQQYCEKVSQPFTQITQCYLHLKYQNKALISDNRSNTRQNHKMMNKNLRAMKKALTSAN